MPTYEYSCKDCREHLEIVQSFKDDALTACPACGGTLRKVFGAIGVVFKGNGFYKTDSRPKASESGASAGSGAAAGSGSSSPSSPSSSESGGSSSGESSPSSPSSSPSEGGSTKAPAPSGTAAKTA